jgi:hypothetical protein
MTSAEADRPDKRPTKTTEQSRRTIRPRSYPYWGQPEKPLPFAMQLATSFKKRRKNCRLLIDGQCVESVSSGGWLSTL